MVNIFTKKPPTLSILVIGPPRSDKHAFANKFLIEGFKNNEPGLYIVTHDFPETIMGELRKIYHENLLAMDLIRFIDCYTRYTGIVKPSSQYEIRVDGPTDLNSISIAVSKILNTFPEPRVVLDNVSTLLLHNSPESVEKFLGILIGKFRANKVVSLILIEEGVHSQQQITTIESLTDCTVRFFLESEKKELLFSGRGGKKTVKYKLEDGKLILGSSLL